MASEQILIVEDEEDIQELLRYNLQKEGYSLIIAHTGEQAWEIIQNRPPSLILLDLMLPGISGLEICRRIKLDDKLKKISVIMVTAKGEENDIVKGLELGADDYISKPFSTKILSSRVKSVLRRSGSAVPSLSDELIFRNLTISPGQHKVRADRQVIDLTASEFKTLHLLARKPGWVYTRAQIVESVHGDYYPVTDRAVDVLIVGLRKKLGKAGNMVETVRGVGYRFRED